MSDRHLDSHSIAIFALGIAYRQLSGEALTDPACKRAADLVFEARNLVMGVSGLADLYASSKSELPITAEMAKELYDGN